MSKKDKQRAKAAPADKGAQPEAKAAPAVVAKPQMLVVLKKDAKFRGARELWYQRLVEHDGKSIDAFYSSTKDKPPSLPKSGKAEAPGGWLSYFKRQGVVEVKPAA